MLKNIKDTALQTIIYGIGNIIIKAAGLILLPIYASELSTNEFGMLSILEVSAQFLVAIVAFRLPNSLLRWGSAEPDPELRKEIYFTSWFTLTLIIIAFNLLFIPFSGFFSELFFSSSEYSRYFILLFASVSFEILGLMPLQLFRINNKSGYYISLVITKMIVALLLTIYLVKFKGFGVEGAVIGWLAGNIALWLGSLPIQLKNTKIKFNPKLAREMIRYGSPLIVSSIAVLLLNLSDRYIIAIFYTYSDLGIYSMGYKIGSVINLLLIGSFSLSFVPIAFKQFEQSGFNEFFSKMLTYFIAIAVIFTLGICIFSKEILKVISDDNPEYWLAVLIIPFIAFNFIFKAIHFFIALLFQVTRKTKFDAKVVSFGFVLNIILNLILIPIYDIYGAVAATGLSYIFMVWLSHKYVQDIYPIKFENKRLLFLILSCAVFIVFGIFLNELEIGLRLLLKGLLFLTYPLVLFIFIAKKSEKTKLISFVKEYRHPANWKAALDKLVK